MMGPSGTNPVHIDSQGNHVEPPSGIEERIAEVLREHEGPLFMDGVGTFQCECGFDCNERVTIPPEELWATKNWAAHVAAVVAQALQLTEDRRRINPQTMAKPCDNCGHLKGVHGEPCVTLLSVRRDDQGWPLDAVECGCPEHVYTPPNTSWQSRWVSPWLPVLDSDDTPKGLPEPNPFLACNYECPECGVHAGHDSDCSWEKP